MLKYFICPDGEQVIIEDCLKSCRMNDRHKCPDLPILERIASGRRTWTGTPSVTQLICGTCQAYLQIKNDYAVKPDDSVFAILGTAVHSLIEQDNDRTTSKTLRISGVPDRYDDTQIIDYKVSGIYKFKGGDKADWFLQVNMYRILLKEVDGKDRKEMWIHGIARDASKIKGDTTCHWLKVPVINDDSVIVFFETKRDRLMLSLRDGIIPEECTPAERWERNGKLSIKCKYYCPVLEFCPYRKDKNK